jgi:hypothetical protein
MNARRPTLIVLVTILVGGTLAYSSATALAVTATRRAITALGPFTDPQGVAVDQANGNLLVVNGAAEGNPTVNTVEIFNEEGTDPPADGAPEKLTGAETPAKSFETYRERPTGIAIDNSCFYKKLSGAACTSFDASNEDVYITDNRRGNLYKLRLNGSKYEYVCGVNGWYGVGVQACLESGGSPVESQDFTGVATDEEGNVYVTAGYGLVDEYNSKGEGVRQLRFALELLTGIALAPNGDLYASVTPFDGANFSELMRNPAGEPIEELGLGQAQGVGFDPVSGHLLAGTNEGGVTEYDSEGQKGETFGASVIGKGWGIAVNATSGRVYISNGRGNLAQDDGDVYVYGPLARLAQAATTHLSNTQSTSITLNGTVNPQGLAVTGCSFEYGLTTSYGSSLPCSPAGLGSGESPVEISANLTGLEPHTVYHYRIVTVNSEGNNTTSDETFLTGASVVDRPAFASGVTQSSVIFNGTVNAGAIPTSYHFAYGTSTAYGSVAPSPDVGLPVAPGDISVTQEVAGLQPDTTYHFALVANSPAGPVVGPDEQFTTPAIPPPVASTGGSSGASVGAVTLTGAVDPQGWDTGYSFEYGTTTAYGASWPTIPIDMGALMGSQPVTIYLQNLLPGTLYHYRLVASNGGGTSYGADQTFTTQEYPTSVVQEAPVLAAPIGINPEVGSSSRTPAKYKATRKRARKRKRKAGVRRSGKRSRRRG